MAVDRQFSSRELAEILGTETWRIQRIFQDGTLPEPPRLAGRRCIQSSQIPAIVDALRARRWLPDLEGAAK